MTRSVTAAHRSRMADLAEQFEDIFMAPWPDRAAEIAALGAVSRIAWELYVVAETLLLVPPAPALLGEHRELLRHRLLTLAARLQAGDPATVQEIDLAARNLLEYVRPLL